MNTTVTRPAVTQAQPAALPPLGLHGHMLGANIARVAAAETLGTFVLVFRISCTAIAATLAKPVAGAPYDSPAVPLAGALALASMVSGLGPVFVDHLNPAVTGGP